VLKPLQPLQFCRESAKDPQFSFANCCLVASQMNLVFWALRRSRFEDIQSAKAPIAWCMVRAAPIAGVEGQCKYAWVSSAYSWLNTPYRKIREYQCQKCRVGIVREPRQNLGGRWVCRHRPRLHGWRSRDRASNSYHQRDRARELPIESTKLKRICIRPIYNFIKGLPALLCAYFAS